MEVDDEDFRSSETLLAIHDEIAVGFIASSLLSEISPALMWVIQIGVHPEWRGRGIGSALLSEVIQRFHADDREGVLLEVHVDNVRAASVYKRIGFKAIGQRGRFAEDLK